MLLGYQSNRMNSSLYAGDNLQRTEDGIIDCLDEPQMKGTIRTRGDILKDALIGDIGAARVAKHIEIIEDMLTVYFDLKEPADFSAAAKGPWSVIRFYKVKPEFVVSGF